MVDLVGQDSSRGDVVAVAEAAGDRQDLRRLQQPGSRRSRLTCTISVADPASSNA
jgi:hypothetical protein